MEENKNKIIILLKGIVISCLVTIILIATYSALLAYTDLSEGTISIVMPLIAILSVLIGSSLSCRKLNEKGIVNGAIFGVMYLLINYLLNGIMGAGFGVEGHMIISLIMMTVSGIIGGVVGVNM